MALYEVQGPDGSVFEIEGPDDATDDEIAAFAESQFGQQQRPQRTLDDYKAMSTPTAAPDIVGEMNAGQRFLAGTGMGMARLGRGVGQAVGLVDQSEIDQARSEEAALEATTAGKVGNFAGTVAGLLPTAFIPGANTLAGAAAIGAGSGALATEGGLKDRAIAAGGGILGGAGGLLAGRGIATGLQRLGQRAADAGAERAATNEAVIAARQAGRVLPPSEMAQSAPGRFAAQMLESVAGKEAMGQAASVANQRVTNAGLRADLGLTGKGQITVKDIAALKKPHFEAYREAENLSPDAAEAVKLWRKANFDAKRHALHYKVSKSPDADDAAQAARADADTYMQMVEAEAIDAGKPELARRLAEARMKLGEIGTLEAALNKSTGNVSAKSLQKAMDRGAPLKGNAREAAKFNEAFEDYSKVPKRAAPGVSKLDAFAGALMSGAFGPKALAITGLPYITRNALLSRPVQALAAPSVNPGASRLALGNALNRPGAQRYLPVAGNALARDQQR